MTEEELSKTITNALGGYRWATRMGETLPDYLAYRITNAMPKDHDVIVSLRGRLEELTGVADELAKENLTLKAEIERLRGEILSGAAYRELQGEQWKQRAKQAEQTLANVRGRLDAVIADSAI